MRLKFLAHTVRYNFVPIDFGSGHRQSSPQSLERSLGHRLIVLGDGGLIQVLGLLDQMHDVLSQLDFVSYVQGLFDLLRADQLNVAFLVVVHLDFEDTFDVGVGTVYRDGPLGSPPSVPEVLGFEAVIFDAGGQYDRSSRLGLPEHAADSVLVVVPGVLEKLEVQGGPPGFGVLVKRVRLEVGGVLPQVVVPEGLPTPGIVEPVVAQVVVLRYEDQTVRVFDPDRGQLVLVVLGEGRARSLFQQVVVVQQLPHVVEDFVELAGGRVQYEIGHDADLLLVGYYILAVGRHFHVALSLLFSSSHYLLSMMCLLPMNHDDAKCQFTLVTLRSSSSLNRHFSPVSLKIYRNTIDLLSAGATSI